MLGHADAPHGPGFTWQAALAEGKDPGLDPGLSKGDLDRAVAERRRPADQLVEPRLGDDSATFRVDVTRRTAGMAGYRPLAYKDDCTCFQYVGPLVKAP